MVLGSMILEKFTPAAEYLKLAPYPHANRKGRGASARAKPG